MRRRKPRDLPAVPGAQVLTGGITFTTRKPRRRREPERSAVPLTCKMTVKVRATGEILELPGAVIKDGTGHTDQEDFHRVLRACLSRLDDRDRHIIGILINGVPTDVEVLAVGEITQHRVADYWTERSRVAKKQSRNRR